MSSHLGLVLHVQEGNGGLQGWFNNPNSQASSTFWVSKSGLCEQYVDADLQAWAQANGNTTYNSVETEGYTTEPLTDAQISALADLYRWGNKTYGWPYTLSDTVGTKGFAWHGMGGAAWGNHPSCPGDIRRNQRQAVLDRANSTPTPPTPTTEDPDMVIIRSPAGSMSMFDGYRKIGLVSTTDANAFKDTANIPIVNISQNQYDRIPNS